MSYLWRASDARLEISLLACVMLLSACTAKEPPARPPPEIKVVEVVQRDTILKQDFVGQTLGSTEIPIRARVEGVLESRSFIEGSAVTKGQLLYVIDGRPFRAKVVESEGRLAESLTQLAKTLRVLSLVARVISTKYA
jgi:membrane fusion protein (multidrug efflux system)